MQPRDRAPYSAIIDRPPRKLPGNARIVVWSIVNLEVWDIGRPMARQQLSPPTGQTLLPDVPTVRDLGFPNMELAGWNGYFAPARTPEPVIAKLHSAIKAVADEPEIRKRLANAAKVQKMAVEQEEKAKQSVMPWPLSSPISPPILDRVGVAVQSNACMHLDRRARTRTLGPHAWADAPNLEKQATTLNKPKMHPAALCALASRRRVCALASPLTAAIDRRV